MVAAPSEDAAPARRAGATDDALLVERCRSGDLAAFEPLVEHHRHGAWRLAMNVVHDREDAWDVTQDAFIRAWQALPSFRGQSAFSTWLFRIVINVALDTLRQRWPNGRARAGAMSADDLERELVDPDPAPDRVAARLEERERIMRALDMLPEHHRMAIVLSDLEGLTYREIADLLEIPIGTVMSRLHHGRTRLRRVLKWARVNSRGSSPRGA